MSSNIPLVWTGQLYRGRKCPFRMENPLVSPCSFAVGQKEAPERTKRTCLNLRSQLGTGGILHSCWARPTASCPPDGPQSHCWGHGEAGVFQKGRQGQGLFNRVWPVSASTAGPCASRGEGSGQAGCLVPDASRQPVPPDRTRHAATSPKLAGPCSHHPAQLFLGMKSGPASSALPGAPSHSPSYSL